MVITYSHHWVSSHTIPKWPTGRDHENLYFTEEETESPEVDWEVMIKLRVGGRAKMQILSV